MKTHRKDGTFRKGHKARQKGPRKMDVYMIVRTSRETKARWMEAAKTAGETLSEWVTCNLDNVTNQVGYVYSVANKDKDGNTVNGLVVKALDGEFYIPLDRSGGFPVASTQPIGNSPARD